MLYKDEQGNEYEVFTAEDVESKIEEAKNSAYEEALAELGDSDLGEKLLAAEKELKELKEKNQSMSGNLSGQRSVIEKKEEEVSSLKNKVEELAKSQAEVLSQLNGASVKQKLSALTADKEILEKAEKTYNDFFASKATTEAEKDKFIQDALLIASNGSIKVGANMYSNVGTSPEIKPTGESKLSDIGVKLAKDFGYDEEQLKKHKLI
jgi:chromosome segregation ATPase